MILSKIFHHSWHPLLPILSQEPLLSFNTEILPNTLYYPQKDDIFRVFKQPLENIKVVILGQDPYPGPNQANGLAFAVNDMMAMPASLKIIVKEIELEKLTTGFYDSDVAHWRTLEHWEEQGVFLLNTALTVHSGEPGSHLKYWEHFIKNVVNYISVKQPCVWMLWGQKAHMFTNSMPLKTLFHVKDYTLSNIETIPTSPYYNYLLKSAHPAAEAYRPNAGYLGNNHFTFANTILSKLGKKSINW